MSEMVETVPFCGHKWPRPSPSFLPEAIIRGKVSPHIQRSSPTSTVFAATGLRALFNQLRDKLYPEGDYWQKVLRYCEAGNLQAVLDEYVFQLRSKQTPVEITNEQLWALGR